MFNIIFTIVIYDAIVKYDAARILGVFPTPSISHQVVFRPVMHELAKRGHEVVVITPNPTFVTNNENIKEIDVHNVSYSIWNYRKRTLILEKGAFYIQAETVLTLLNKVIEAQIHTDAVQKLINDRNKKFDLIFIEACAVPTIAFSYLYNAPVIEFSSLGGVFESYHRVGAAYHRLFYPKPICQRIFNLTIWDKLTELYIDSVVEYFYTKVKKSANEMLKKIFGPNIPEIEELQKNIHMTFLNVHPIWDFNRPVPPNIIYLGGLHQNAKKELPKDLKSYLDASQNGVIYMSFGTNAHSSLLSKEKIKIFTNVFSRLSYNVLWKWDIDILPGMSKNIKISKWFPQSDLLRHPKIKLFITQGGLQSTDEALTAGVPLIAVPILADQWFNAEQYLVNGIGIKLNMETMTEEMLKEAIETVITVKSYRENAIKLSNIMRDLPQSSLERAVWWTEYVLRHGGATHLRAAAAGLHWTEYYMLDVLLVIVMFFGTAAAITAVVMRLLYIKYKQIKSKNKKIN